MNKLSVCLIVKDEEPVLGRCLTCAAQFADELIVVDTGSSDRTVEIALEYTPYVYNHPWQHSFSEARNYSYAKASGDYIMWLDADDIISEDGVAGLLALKDEIKDEDVIFTSYMCFSESGITNCILRDRIIKRTVFTEWKYDIHEAILIEPQWKRCYRPDIEIVHKKEHINEPQRNLTIFRKLLETEKPLELFEKVNLIKEYSLNRNTNEALKLFHEIQPELTAEGNNYSYVLVFLMQGLMKAKQWEECFSVVEEAEMYIPHTAMMKYAKGRCMEELGDAEKAEMFYHEAMYIKEDPLSLNILYTGYDNYYPYIRLAYMAKKQGNLYEALKLLKCAENNYPKDIEWQKMRLRILLNIEDIRNKENTNSKIDEKEMKPDEIKKKIISINNKLSTLSKEELHEVIIWLDSHSK